MKKIPQSDCASPAGQRRGEKKSGIRAFIPRGGLLGSGSSLRLNAGNEASLKQGTFRKGGEIKNTEGNQRKSGSHSHPGCALGIPQPHLGAFKPGALGSI